MAKFVSSKVLWDQLPATIQKEIDTEVRSFVAAEKTAKKKSAAHMQSAHRMSVQPMCLAGKH